MTTKSASYRLSDKCRQLIAEIAAELGVSPKDAIEIAVRQYQSIIATKEAQIPHTAKKG